MNIIDGMNRVPFFFSTIKNRKIDVTTTTLRGGWFTLLPMGIPVIRYSHGEAGTPVSSWVP